jgi:hypothetical protein
MRPCGPLEAPAAASPRRYPEYVLKHGLTRVRATLDWIDETTAAIESDTRRAASGATTEA